MNNHVENPNTHNRLVVKYMNIFTLISFVLVLILFASTACSKPSDSSENITEMSEVKIKINKLFRQGGKTPAEPDEYVQINNSGEAPADLTNWILVNDIEGQPSFKFPAFII